MPDEGAGSPGLVVFTRDLRIDDHPALSAALVAHERVLPAFVLDRVITEAANASRRRLAFLSQCLSDLDHALRARGGALVVRRGHWVEEVLRLAAASGARDIYVTDDVSPYARARLTDLRRSAGEQRIRVLVHPGVSVVGPGDLVPAGSDHYQVFTPYHRRWMDARWRCPLVRPRRVHLPTTVSQQPLRGGWLPKPASAVASVGGSTPGRRRLDTFLRTGLVGYGERDQLADPSTSRLSAYLHFGCLSPLEVALAATEHEDAGAFLRQLCWRDFFIQVMAVRTEVAWSDVRPRGAPWATRPRHLARWQEGSTGYPVVDAAMRQLSQTGTMPNRARMVVASFLIHDLGIDWRLGARHFLRTLVDGDVAVNNLNWQWVAGTGTDRSPWRVLNPTRQGLRFDPAGSYVRRFVPELRSVRDRSVHDPDPDVRRRLGYPMPVSDHRWSRA